MEISMWGLIGAIPFAVGVAWSLGANDVANSMGTSVGSQVLSLRQALLVAGVLEFSGAVLFSQRVATRLANLVNPERYATDPQLLVIGMLSVLIATTLWIQIATILGNPVSSTHTVVGATAGFSVVAVGIEGVNWSSLGWFSLAWILTPVLSGIVAVILYSQLRRGLLDQKSPLEQWWEWCPWLSALAIGVFGTILAPLLIQIGTQIGTSISTQIPGVLPGVFNGDLPPHTYALLAGSGVVLILTGWGLRPGKTDPPQVQVERRLGGFQVLSACFVAFAHGANDIGNAIAPLAVIGFILTHGQVPDQGLVIPVWMVLLGGTAIVIGLGVQGQTVIRTVGSTITELQPSSGFCAELATATTVLLASRAGLPVSTSHALVGSVFGIGLNKDQQFKGFGILGSILSAWVLTFPVAAGLGAGIFAGLRAVLASGR